MSIIYWQLKQAKNQLEGIKNCACDNCMSVGLKFWEARIITLQDKLDKETKKILRNYRR